MVIWSVLGGIVFMGQFLVLGYLIWIMVLLFFIGLTYTNIFPFVFSIVIVNCEKANKVFALMIMRVAEGLYFLFL